MFRPSLFSLLVCSALSAKLLSLFQYVNLVNPFLLLVFFPSFFIFEALLFVAVWYSLLKPSGILYALAVAVSAFLTYVLA